MSYIWLTNGFPVMPARSACSLRQFPKKTTDVLVRTMRLPVSTRGVDLAPLALCQSVNEPRAIMSMLGRIISIYGNGGKSAQVIRIGDGKVKGNQSARICPRSSKSFPVLWHFINSSHQQSPIGPEVPVFVSGDLVNVPATWPALVGKLNSKYRITNGIDCPENFPASEL